MATCEKREVKVEPPPVEYVLVLNTMEAKALLMHARGSHAYIMRDILNALDSAGVKLP